MVDKKTELNLTIQVREQILKLLNRKVDRCDECLIASGGLAAVGAVQQNQQISVKGKTDTCRKILKTWEEDNTRYCQVNRSIQNT
jgi:hypothetical protein